MNIGEFNNVQKEIISISLNNIFKKYTINNTNPLTSVQVLRDINITLPLKSLSGLQGMTGCGKSTTGRILTGLLRPDSGEIRLNNNNGNKIILNNITHSEIYLRYISGFYDVPSILLQGIFRHTAILFDRENFTGDNLDSIHLLYKGYKKIRI